MRNLPAAIIQVLRPFKWVFSDQLWDHVKVLLVGAILAPGKRTVTAALRVMGLQHECVVLSAPTTPPLISSDVAS